MKISVAIAAAAVLVGVKAQVPKWTPTYDMQQSTVIMPCNYSGFFDPQFLSQFGLVDFDCK